jgi:hypothetical protein
MTLVLSCLTSEYVVQVSDRRLTFVLPPEKRGQISSDHTNKAINVNGRTIFGFTGLAEIGGQRADQWFADQLARRAQLPFLQAISQTAEELTTEIRRIPRQHKALTRHAYVGVGWATADNEPGIRAAIIEISNFLSPAGEALSTIEDQFSIHIRVLQPNQSLLVSSAGASVNPSIMSELRSNLIRCLKAGTGPDPIARLLAEAIWKVAHGEPTVGTNLMVSSLPKRAVEAMMRIGHMTAAAGRLTSEQAGFGSVLI